MKLVTIFFIFTAQVVSAQYVRYDWQQEYYATIDGQKKLTFTWKFINSKIASGPLFGNDKPDLIVGIKNGTLSLFENQSDAENTRFILKRLRLEGFGINDQNNIFRDYVNQDDQNFSKIDYSLLEDSRPLDFGSEAAPALVDIFNNGLLDLVVGDSQGRLFVFINIGTKTDPQFLYNSRNANTFLPMARISLLGLKNIVPTFCDLNNDQIEDFLIGSKQGKIYAFEGYRDKQKRLWFKNDIMVDLSLPNDENVVPSCYDWEKDGRPGIIAGKRDGRLAYFQNVGEKFAPVFSEPQQNFYGIDAGGNSAPYFFKLNSESDDLLIGNINSRIFHYEVRHDGQKNNLWSINDNFTDYQQLIGLANNFSISAGNIFNDGKQDLIIGNGNGLIALYKNDSQGQEVILEKISDNLFPDISLPQASPEIISATEDNKAALFVGTTGGQVHYFTDVGMQGQPQFVMKKPRVIINTSSNNPIVRSIRLDGQKQSNLLIGGDGALSLYRSVGDYDNPKFIADSLPLSGFTQNDGLFVAPSIFNWNKFDQPNIIIGDALGNISIYNLDPTIFSLLSDVPIDFQRYLAQSFYFPRWNYQEEMPNLRPFFVDINNAGRQSLLVSNDEGDLLLFLQRSSTELDYSVAYRQYLKDKKSQIQSEIRNNLWDFLPRDIAPEFNNDSKTVWNFDDRRLVPSLGNLRSNKLFDLALGTASGRVDIYLNQTLAPRLVDATNPNFLLQQSIQLPEGATNAAPLLIDLDNNGSLDLVVGSSQGKIYYYENTAKRPNFKFILRSGYFSKFNFGFNVVPSKVYVKNKQFPDLILGNRDGQINYLENFSYYIDQKEFKPNFKLQSKNYINLNINAALAPKFEDINNDQLPEMILGTDQGEIMVYRYNTVRKTWVFVPEWSIRAPIGRGAMPAVGIFNIFGLPDMLIGYDDGSLVLLHNKAIDEPYLNELLDSVLEK